MLQNTKSKVHKLYIIPSGNNIIQIIIHPWKYSFRRVDTERSVGFKLEASESQFFSAS